MAEKKRPGQKFKMLSVDEILGVNNEESAIDLKINEIVPFKDHPFRVIDDEKMEELVKSIRMNGILTPVLHSFQNLARDAGAVYKIKGVVLVNTQVVDEYLETFREA